MRTSPASVAATLDNRFIDELPQRHIGDRAYDADPLGKGLVELSVEMIAPHRSNRATARSPRRRTVVHCAATVAAG